MEIIDDLKEEIYKLDAIIFQHTDEFMISQYVAKRVSLIQLLVSNVLEILHHNQDEYVDSAEHVHDGIRNITSHLEDDNIELYIPDFIKALESSANCDISLILKNCANILKL